MVIISMQEPGTPHTPHRESMRRGSDSGALAARRGSQRQSMRRGSHLAVEIDPAFMVAQRDKHHWCIQRSVEIPPAEIRSTFKKFDADRSGYIDKDEALLLMVELYGEEDGEAYAQRLLDQDQDGDGKLSLQEFRNFLTTQQAQRKLSIAEMVFLTFDNPETSVMAKLVSVMIMLLILLSTVLFVLETVPAFRETPLSCSEEELPLTYSKSLINNTAIYTAHPNTSRRSGNCPPQPQAWFMTMETICIAIFTFEYLLRLLTVHAVRAIARQTASAGTDFLRQEDGWADKKDNALVKTIRFALEPMNIIDLIAIFPFYVNLLVSGGGGLAVLRVLRLARIFRIFKLGKYNTNMQMFGNVLYQSLPALQLLIFFFALGVVLFGSMIYFAEQGTWYGPDMICPGMVDAGPDPLCRELGFTEGVYLRSNLLGNGNELSPFSSIVGSFWWVATTATTVGYGDFYPTTIAGKVVAVLCMFGGILVMALPITVLGFNFHNEYALMQAQKLGLDPDEHEELEKLKPEGPSTPSQQGTPRTDSISASPTVPANRKNSQGRSNSQEQLNPKKTLITRTNSIERCARPQPVFTNEAKPIGSLGSLMSASAPNCRVIPVLDSPKTPKGENKQALASNQTTPSAIEGAEALRVLIVAASKLGPRAIPKAKTVFSEQQLCTLAEDASSLLTSSNGRDRMSAEVDFQSFLVHALMETQMGMRRWSRSTAREDAKAQIAQHCHAFHRSLLEFGMACLQQTAMEQRSGSEVR